MDLTSTTKEENLVKCLSVVIVLGIGCWPNTNSAAELHCQPHMLQHKVSRLLGILHRVYQALSPSFTEISSVKSGFQNPFLCMPTVVIDDKKNTDKA